jgi:arsenite/tail-anchored protein-transporting ATPase
MPPTRLDSLANARVAVVAGKGGVGKTTVTAVLARAAFLQGMRVLVIELDGKSTLAQLLGDEPRCLPLSAPAALSEYLDSHGLARVSKRLISSGVIDVVATAAPGIDDIVVLGKIKQLERSGEYDLIVVDGPAAGHAITMLMSAASMQRTMRGGPVRTQADEVAAMLADPARCQIVLVTLPETTPINEAIDTAFSLEEHVGVQLGMLVVNAVDEGEVLDVSAAAAGSPEASAAKFRNARRALHRSERERLADQLALPQLTLPLVPAAHLDAARISELAHGLLEAS